MARLFVAAWPPPDIVDRLRGLPRSEVEGVRWTTPEQWHVTLRFLGSVDDADPIRVALGDAAGSTAGRPPPRAVVGPVVGRLGNRLWVVPVGGLDDLAAAVHSATGNLGEPPEPRPFVGHITLARIGRHFDPDPGPPSGAEVEGAWEVDEVTLVESRLASSGARYSVVHRVGIGR